jgi:hypothetical protein
VAALAGVFLEPSPENLDALAVRLGTFVGASQQTVSAAVHVTAQLHQLSPPMKAFALAPLTQDPPLVIDFHARVTACSVPFTAESLRALNARGDPDHSAALRRALVDLAQVSGQQTALAEFLGAELATNSLGAQALEFATQHLDGRAGVSDELALAMEALRDSDVITRPGALEAVLAEVLKKAGTLAPSDLVKEALLRLYQQDLATVSPLSEVSDQPRALQGRPVRRPAVNDATGENGAT